MENNVEEQQSLMDFEAEEAQTEKVTEQTADVGAEEREEEESEVSLDDLDAVPAAEKFRVITDEDVLPETLTISNVKLGKAYSKDLEGNPIEPETNSKGGKYYKAKLIVEIEENISGDRIRTFIPSIFYGVAEDETIAKVPTIPRECPDEKLDDKFTSEISKLRNKYAKFVGKEAKEISSSEFVKGLVGLKFTPVKEKGEYKKKPWVKLAIGEFVK